MTSNYDKTAARELAARTGMKYTAALALVTSPDHLRQPQARWVLNDSVRQFFAGKPWHGLYFENLYDWLDNEVHPTYECDSCGDTGDARTQDSSIEITYLGYDPDFAARTPMMTTKKYHAACRASATLPLIKADIPVGPMCLVLPASAKPDMHGEFDITAHPILDEDNFDAPAMLLLSVAVTEDHDQGSDPWLSELEIFMRANGFAPDGDIPILASPPPQWSLRVQTGYRSELTPQWLALRTGQLELGTLPDHFYLGALDLPEQWVSRAHDHGRVLLAYGPLARTWTTQELGKNATIDQLFSLLEEDSVLTRMVPVADRDNPAQLSPNSQHPEPDEFDFGWD